MFHDLLGGSDPKNGKTKLTRRTPVSRGPLHEVFTRGLPDLVNEEHKICDINKLAKALEVTPQCIYRWMPVGKHPTIPLRQADRIIALSEKQTTGSDDFKPLTRDDFIKFLC